MPKKSTVRRSVNPHLLFAWQSRTPEQRRNLAKRLGTSYIYLSHVCQGRRQLSWENALRYAAALKIDRALIRPDIWELPNTT